MPQHKSRPASRRTVRRVHFAGRKKMFEHWMTDNILKFHDGLPDDCPVPEAEAISKRVYRGIRKKLPNTKDFESEAERRAFSAGEGRCVDWGLSTWVSRAAVEWARKIVPGFDRKAIVGFDATPADGMIAHTPTGPQPEHHTFWKVVDVDLCPRCTIEYERNDG